MFHDRHPTVPATLHVVAWHWGQVGAGAKFSLALLGELARIPGMRLDVSYAEGSEFAIGSGLPDTVGTHPVRTFRGDKRRLAGRLAAGLALLRLPWIARALSSALGPSPDSLALCTFQSIWDAGATGFLRRRVGRFVLVLHDAKFHPGDGYPFRSHVLRRQVEAADGLIVLSEHIGREAQALYGFPADRIWTVPHGAFDFGLPSHPRRLPQNRPVRLLFLGRILAYKGLALLVEACGLLQARGLRVDLDIVGHGDISGLADALKGLTGLTVTNRWVDEGEIGDALARCDLVVLPYVEASQSGVAAAAMTAGLPIVATPVGGLTEQVEHGRTGLVADAVSAEALARSIRRLCGDAGLYAACSSAALERASGEMGWGRIAGLVDGILRQVAGRPRRRAETEASPCAIDGLPEAGPSQGGAPR